jgi:hypothetical protein
MAQHPDKQIDGLAPMPRSEDRKILRADFRKLFLAGAFQGPTVIDPFVRYDIKNR